MAREKRTDQELLQASLAVQYELVMMGTSHQLLQELRITLNTSNRDRTISNALVHSFLLASRALLDFLYPRSPWPSDIIALDYFDTAGAWEACRKTPVPEMADGTLAKQIGAWLAHLTYGRAGNDRPLWGFFAIERNICEEMRCFTAATDESRVHPHLRQDLAARLRVLNAMEANAPDLIDTPIVEMVSSAPLDYHRELARRGLA